LHVKAAYIDDTFTANKIVGGTLTLGGSGNTSGTLTVKNASNSTIGTWDNSGLTLNKGSIAGPSVTLGGNGNSSGVMRILDSNNAEIGTWDNNGIDISQGDISFNGSYGGYPYTLTMGSTRDTPILLFNGGANYSYEAILSPQKIEMRYTLENLVRLASLSYDELIVSGTKSRLVATDQYSDRLLYCYETPTPMFGDIGDGVISDDGSCYVMLDAVFAQTVTTEQYQVFLQKYGPGDCWVKERKGAYFIVEGTPGMSFGWEIKAKQRDYDQLRLERNDEKFTVPTQTYGEDAAKHINDIQKERISA
jgi:hypothetical protein